MEATEQQAIPHLSILANAHMDCFLNLMNESLVSRVLADQCTLVCKEM